MYCRTESTFFLEKVKMENGEKKRGPFSQRRSQRKRPTMSLLAKTKIKITANIKNKKSNLKKKRTRCYLPNF